MTPKEKANELANKMYNGNVFNKTKNEHLVELDNAKRCALIAVYEILNINSVDKDFDLSNYWQEVEIEIEKL